MIKDCISHTLQGEKFPLQFLFDIGLKRCPEGEWNYRIYEAAMLFLHEKSQILHESAEYQALTADDLADWWIKSVLAFRGGQVPVHTLEKVQRRKVDFRRSAPGKDLTLVCADGRKVQVHRLALASVSPVLGDHFQTAEGEEMNLDVNERYILHFIGSKSSNCHGSFESNPRRFVCRKGVPLCVKTYGFAIFSRIIDTVLGPSDAQVGTRNICHSFS